MFIADDAPTSTKLRRSGMIPSSVGARSRVHAAPTELGYVFGQARAINMALLPELEPKATRLARNFCSHNVQPSTFNLPLTHQRITHHVAISSVPDGAACDVICKCTCFAPIRWIRSAITR